MSVNNITNIKIGFNIVQQYLELDLNNIKALYILDNNNNIRLPNINDDIYYEGLLFDIYNNTNNSYYVVRYNQNDIINGVNGDYEVSNTQKSIRLFLYKVNQGYNQWIVI